MNSPDRDPGLGADELAATPLERDLAALLPAAPSVGLRERIAAELSSGPAMLTRGADFEAPRGADFQSARNEPASAPASAPRGRAVRGIIERLAWAVGGAVAASLMLGLPAGDAGREVASERPAEADPAAIVAAERPAEPAVPLRFEQAGRWADEGVRFLDDTTPARILRRMVVERHRAPGGQAEVRVPRADVILLPVAFQ